MKYIQFLWDDNKNNENVHKHGVSFEEAQSAFFDPSARLRYDPDHSENEERFILLGMSYRLRLLVVVHSYKKSEEIIRIISARKATKNESCQYTQMRDE